MAWRETIYRYDGSFDGFLCCVYESYVQKERPTAIFSDGDDVPALFSSQCVQTDQEHAWRVERSLSAFSPKLPRFLRRVFLTCLPEKEMATYRFIAKLYREGASLLRRLSDETYVPLRQAVRHLATEAEKLRGFVRFSDFGGVLAAEIEPKNRILPILQVHFCERCKNENFFLYDRTHKEALLYWHGAASIVPIEQFHMAAPDETEAAFRRLWKQFYETISIRERENPRLQRSNMPKRYRGVMTEFQGEDSFTPASASAVFEVPDAPGGTPAPAIPRSPAPPAVASFP